MSSGAEQPPSSEEALASNLDRQFQQFNKASEIQFRGFSQASEQAFAQAFVQQWQTFNRALIDPIQTAPKPLAQPGLPASPQAVLPQAVPPQTVLPQKHSSPTVQSGKSNAANAPSSTPAPALRSSFFPAANNQDLYGHRVPALPLQRPLPRLQGVDPASLLSFRQQALQQQEFLDLLDYYRFLKDRTQADSYASLLLGHKLCLPYALPGNELWACTWLLAQSQGQDVRLGLQQDQLLLLAASDQQWYEHPFFTLEKRRFYVINKANYQHLAGPVQLQSAAHSEALQPTQITLSRGLAAAQVHLLPRSKFGLNLLIDQDHVNYLFQLPVLAISDYLHDAIPSYLTPQLATAFTSPSDPVTATVQLQSQLQHLPYQIDEEQFGYEKPLTLSELIYFDYSDCEDRVYALAALSRQFWQQTTAGLRYPGHLSAAVKLQQRWHEADPTYLGATLDMRQPAYADAHPEWVF